MTDKNFFQLFDLKVHFYIDKNLLDQKLFEKQSQFHPDKHINDSSEIQEKILEKSQQLNYAYKILKSDFARAEHILHLQGIDLANERLSPAFLEETFEWRTRLSDNDSLPNLKSEVEATIAKTLANMGLLLEKKLYNEAKSDYIKLKFLKRFLEEIENAINT